MTVKYDVVSIFILLFLLRQASAQTETTAAAPPPFNFNIGPAFNPTMAIVMIVLVSAFFSLGFFSVYLRRCAERRLHGGATASDGPLLFGGGRRSWRMARGVGDEVIRTFPTFQYSAVKRLKIGKGSLECAVCLNEFEDDETLRLLPKCSHVFHSDCVDAWLASHVTCPVCRANLIPKPGENFSSAAVQIIEPAEPEADPGPVLRSPEVNIVSPGQNRPPRTKSSGLRFAGLFSRSHSTGHSLVQLGENCERYTLRLPEEVRNQILISSLNRTRSLGVLPRARSERRGYRSGSIGKSNFHYERFDREERPDRWAFSRTPPFISRTGSVWSSRTPPRSLLQSFKTPVDRLFLGSDDVGERSSDRLRQDSQV